MTRAYEYGSIQDYCQSSTPNCGPAGPVSAGIEARVKLKILPAGDADRPAGAKQHRRKSAFRRQLGTFGEAISADTVLHPADILLPLKDILLEPADILLTLKDILLSSADTLLALADILLALKDILLVAAGRRRADGE